MKGKAFLAVTALAEGGTGAALLAAPATVISLLLGVAPASPEALVVARVLGGALVAIAVACWPGRNQIPSLLLTAVLIYDLAAAIILGVAGAGGGMVGIALWPAIAAHVGLAVWCVVTIVSGRPAMTDAPAQSHRGHSSNSHDTRIPRG